MKRPLTAVCIFLIALLLLRALCLKEHPEDFSEADGKTLTLSGTTDRIESRLCDDKISHVIYLKDVSLTDPDMHPSIRSVLLYPSSGSDIESLRIGSRILVSGRAFSFERATNPGQFDSLLYYRTLGFDLGMSSVKILRQDEGYSPVKDRLYRIRRDLSLRLDRSLPTEEAGIMKTMLLGEKGMLDPELRALYQRNGIAHILSISGLHISILGMGIFRLLKKAGMRLSFCAAISSGVLILYGIMTGFPVSSIRAVFMFSVSMLALILKRSYDLLTALTLSAFLILAAQPLYLFHSGFLYSYGCVGGIALFLPMLTKDESHPGSSIRAYLLSPLAVFLITLPLNLWFTGRAPLLSMLLNLLVIPAMGLLVPVGIFLLLSTFIGTFAAVPFRLLIVGILGFFREASSLADLFPFATYHAGRPAFFQILLYAGTAVLVLCFRKKISFPLRWGILLLSTLVLLLRIRSGLEITFLDVGQGDGILLRARSSECPVMLPGLSDEFVLLIDTGSTSVSEVGKYRLIPYLHDQGIPELDAVLVTHPDLDHYGGILELMEQNRTEGIKIRNLWLPDIAVPEQSEGIKKLTEAAESSDIPVSFVSDTCVISPGIPELSLKILHPSPEYPAEDPNEASVCLYVEKDGFTALFTGDIQGAGEERLIRKLKSANTVSPLTVLKVAHHGSGNSTPEEFLSLTHPSLSVISCGEGNSYGHPHAELLDRLNDAGTKIYRTDELGAVRISFDGKRVRIRNFG